MKSQALAVTLSKTTRLPLAGLSNQDLQTIVVRTRQRMQVAKLQHTLACQQGRRISAARAMAVWTRQYSKLLDCCILLGSYRG
jgi:hypothetical protein